MKQIKDREKEVYKVTLWGSLVNVVLVVFKFVAGIVGHSSAMIADAVHSVSDFATDIIVLAFVRISHKPKDKSHDYGHGKFETLATTLIGIALFAVAVGIFIDGAKKIMVWAKGGELPQPGWLALAAALVSIVLKELTFQYTKRKAEQLDSQAMKANAWHHRSDALSSIGTAIGIGGAILLGERWTVLDPIASIAVGALIVKVAVDLLKNGMDELMEKSLPEEVENEILDIVRHVPGVKEPHDLCTRRIGNHYAIEMHILMDGDIPLKEAHDKATEMERLLKERYGEETHISIHVDNQQIQCRKYFGKQSRQQLRIVFAPAIYTFPAIPIFPQKILLRLNMPVNVTFSCDPVDHCLQDQMINRSFCYNSNHFFHISSGTPPRYPLIHKRERGCPDLISSSDT